MRKMIFSALAMALVRWLTKSKARPARRTVRSRYR